KIIDQINKLQDEMLKQTNSTLFAISDLRSDIDASFARVSETLQAVLEATLFGSQYAIRDGELARAETAIDDYVSRSRAVALGQDNWKTADLASIQKEI